MPRKKAKPNKRDGSDETSSSQPKKKQKWKARRRLLQTYPADMILLGESPVLCLCRNDVAAYSLPTFLTTDIAGGDNIAVNAEFPGGLFVPVVEPHAAVEFLLSQYPAGRNYALICAKTSLEELFIDIGVTSLPWTDATSIVEMLYDKDYSLFPLDEELKGNEGWATFFNELSCIHSKRVLKPEGVYQHVDLKPVLRGYQAAAVEWMISREQSPLATLDITWLNSIADLIFVRGGPPLIYNKYSGVLSKALDPITIASGGILADEMGLGKTVITLALILNHKRGPVEIPPELEPPKRRNDNDDDDDFSDDSECSSDSEIDRNQENCLDASEELQYCVPRKPARGILKTKLTEWYNSMLAEVSTSHPSPKPKKAVTFKCTCGDKASKRLRKRIVTCCGCKLKQHRQCTGFRENFAYYCPPCWTGLPVIPSQASLIVVPQPIFAQWLSEIERHVPSMNVFAYKGVDRQNFVQPTDLASYDVVVTTYDILSNETVYTTEAPQRSRRREERSLRLMCPLTKVGWWRLICDEAQLFESDHSRIQQIIHILTSEHRWSVTGTPIQRSIADLFYLTQFMGLGPLDDKPAWINLLLKPYLAGCKEPLLSVLSQVFWRSSKDEVLEELGLPEQVFTRHLLHFSAIEATFYEQERQNSALNLLEAITKLGIATSRTLDSLDRSSIKKILHPLLNLRQACSHPQAVKGVTISSTSGAANLGDLLAYLSKKTKLECEEGLRRHIAAVNGMAGLLIENMEYPDAVECYRNVLRITEEYKEKVHVDTLQRIHALTNADQILREHPLGIPPTLRDDSLGLEARELEKKYRSKQENEFKSSFSSFNTLHKEVTDLENTFESAHDAYWLPIFFSISRFETELVDKLQEQLASTELSEKNAVETFLRSMRSFQVTIGRWCSALKKNYTHAVNAMQALTEVPVSILVQQATACHLRMRTNKKKQKICELCKAEEYMLDLECNLFDTKRKEKSRVKDEGDNKLPDGLETKGSWKASKEERALLIMVSFARNKVTLEPWTLADFAVHKKMLDAMKKAFKQLRASWTGLNHLVQAEDELAMAKIRLRVADDYEEVPKKKVSALSLTLPNKLDTIHIVAKTDVPSMLIGLTSDRDLSLSIFKKKYGQMMYLENLGKNRQATPDPCPVCKVVIEKEMVALECGHCFCLTCIQTLCKNKIKCPVCREVTSSANLSFVFDGKRPDNSDIPVLGDLPTKADAIVRTALKLLKDEPSTKIIIFSTWLEVLKVLEKGLNLNQIALLRLQSGKHKQILERFRDPDGGVSVLLLPLSWGARGLNLIEATHVFLTEPILNPSVELQAIGRVHRIGQTKVTTVHRFLVAGTVEEKIQVAVSEAKDKWSNQQFTLNDLKDLLTASEIAESVQ